MDLIKSNDIYIFKGTFDECMSYAKPCRFRWDPHCRHWWTGNPAKAERLRGMIHHTELQRRVREQLVPDKLPVPDGLEYLPYQKDAIRFSIKNPNALLALEMGLGKTICAIGLMNALQDEIKRVLVVCPASLKINWTREIMKWSCRSVMPAVCNGRYIPGNVVIINYDILVKHHNNLCEKEWDLIVADECHYVKTPSAKRSKAFYSLPTKRRLYLTGTPILNRPIELQPLLKGLGVPWAYNRVAFGKRYCDGKKGRYGWDFRGSSNLPELNQKLSGSVMVRYRKQDVLKDLPDKRRELIILSSQGNTALDKEKQALAAMKAAEQRLINQVETATGAEYKAAIVKLRDYRMFIFSELSRLRHETARSKLPQAISCIKDMLEETDKLVVFAHHHDIIDELYNKFPAISVRLTGRNNLTDRQDAVDRFQCDPSCRLFIGNIKAAGVGLTLTAASTVLFTELDWTPANMDQAESRLHRIGQKDCVNVYYMVIEDSLDAFIAKKLVTKEKIIDMAIDNTASAHSCMNIV
jgi:SNF2 family DNA or RNA helicase